jgi:hypothetical protein
VELKATLFFPQEDYQCGPAALATLLTTIGIDAPPERLVSQVFIPERQGSLQVEMLATGRRQGAVSVLIPPRLDALLTEVAAGHPVVVLQNLGLSQLPFWHYAVVVGYDLAQGEIILRSGVTQRLAMRLQTFEHTWARSGYWGMVTLQPGRLPRTPDQETMTAALIAFEREHSGRAAYQAYRAALVRWPGDLTLMMGAGNAAFAMKDYKEAAAAFSQAVKAHPDSAPAYNNLALTLAHLQRFDEARNNAAQALSLGETWRASVIETIKTIDALERQLKK